MFSIEMDDTKSELAFRDWSGVDNVRGILHIPWDHLLAMGNIMFMSGLALTIGPKSTLQFFMKPQNFKGTISFDAGFCSVIIGWPIPGMILESYGFIILFSGFWPTVVVYLQRIPLLGWVFQLPFIRSLLDRYRGKRVPV